MSGSRTSQPESRRARLRRWYLALATRLDRPGYPIYVRALDRLAGWLT